VYLWIFAGINKNTNKSKNKITKKLNAAFVYTTSPKFVEFQD